MRRWPPILGFALTAALFATPAGACGSLLAAHRYSALRAGITTMNNRNVASYIPARLEYVRTQGPGRIPGHWASGPDRPHQYFSDRPTGFGPFSHQRTDRVSVYISDEPAPLIVLTLHNWGNATLGFRGTCSANGVIHGSSGESDILIHLVRTR